MQKRYLSTLGISVSAGAILVASFMLPLAASANDSHDDDRDNNRSHFASPLGDQVRDSIRHTIDDKKRDICDRFENRFHSRFPWVKGPSFCRGGGGGNQNAPTVSISAEPIVVTAGGSSLLSWESGNANSCTASGGWSGSKSLSGSQSVVVNATTTYTLSCTNSKGTTSESVTVNVTPVVVPPAPTVTLNASPLTVQVGATSTLTWSSTNANACVASNGWSGSKSLSGSQTGVINATTTFTLACGNGMATDTKSVTVNATPVPPLPTPTVDISADPNQVAPGGASILAWISTNATACTASNGWNGTKTLSGNTVVTPSATTTYTIACGNGVATTTDSVTINVYPLPTVTLGASPLAIIAGATSTLTWTSEFATGCTASNGWAGAKLFSGNEILSPNATTTYTLTCVGNGGTASSSVTIGVTPTSSPAVAPTLTFSANPLQIIAGATSTLSWNTINATICSASNGWAGAKSLSGSEIVSPLATTTYHLSCSGPGGATSSDVVVGVTPTSTSPALIGHVVLSEVYYDVGTGKGSEPGNEWVELFNASANPVDLNGWKLEDESGSFDAIATSSLILAPNAYLVVTSSSTTASLWTIPSQVVVLSSPIGNALGNTVDSLILMNAASTTIDTVSWGTATTTTIMVPTVPGVASGHSIGRIQFTADSNTNADWGNFASPTPGQ